MLFYRVFCNGRRGVGYFCFDCIFILSSLRISLCLLYSELNSSFMEKKLEEKLPIVVTYQ